MTVSPLDRVGRGGTAATADRVGQATAVEQARAVAEVAAAVQVAQQNPRDINRAVADMQASCSRMALAERAFYKVPNRGPGGPSVHLARALARIWGNIDYGVRELRRDDEAGESEMLAYAWDQQTNSRSSRSFINPHARMAQGQRKALTDLHDIYLSNQNIGAKAVRETIYAVLPEWFVAEAEDACRRTLKHGDGIPLPQRIENMVGKFRELGITVDQMERKVEKRRGQWDAGDVATFTVIYGSVQRGEVDKDEEFPPQRVTGAEIQQGRAQRTTAQTPTPVDTETGGLSPEPEPGPEPHPDEPTLPVEPPKPSAEPASKAQVTKIQAMFAGAGITDREMRLRYCADVAGRDIASTNDLKKTEASQVIDALTREAS